jgi:hypothetical protein
MSDRALGLGLITAGVLLGAGVPAADALAAAASRLPTGPTQRALSQAAARVRDGARPAGALAEALPALAGIRGGKGLPERLQAVGHDRLNAWRVQRRLAVAARYPIAVAAALLGVVCAVAYAGQHIPDLGGFSLGWSTNALWLGTATIFLGWTVALRERGPRWTRVLPGGRLWRLSDAATFAREYACRRDPRRGGLAPHVALGVSAERPLHAALRDRLSAPEAAELLLGEAAHRPVEAAEGLAARLELEAGEAADRLVAATGLALLLVVALGVAFLASSNYLGLLALSQSL